MQVEIRFATQTDFFQVGKIFAEENRFHATLVPEIIQVADPIMTYEWFDEVLNNSNKKLFVAEIGPDLVGVALVERRDSIDDPIFKPRQYIHINEIAVAISYRRQGIGRKLMDRIHQFARNQGITDIELQVWERNQHAIGFYEKIGCQSWRRTMRFTLDDP